MVKRRKASRFAINGIQLCGPGMFAMARGTTTVRAKRIAKPTLPVFKTGADEHWGDEDARDNGDTVQRNRHRR